MSGFDDEEEAEAEGDASIDDALLSELDDEVLDDDDALEGILDPLAKIAVPPIPDDEEEDEALKEDGAKLFDDDEEEDMDYDSFDDRDEL